MHTALGEELKPVENELKGLKARQMAIEQSQKDKKADELTAEDKKQLEDCNADIEKQENVRRDLWKKYSSENPVVAQLVDLALLQNGLLKGEALNSFIKRSVDLI